MLEESNDPQPAARLRSQGSWRACATAGTSERTIEAWLARLERHASAWTNRCATSEHWIERSRP